VPDRARILQRFGLGERALIGEGAESRVYALSPDRVLRVARSGSPDAAAAARLQVFLARIAGRLPFATPEILEIAPGGEWRIEKRLPGASMLERLRKLGDDRRDEAFRNYLAAADALATVALPDLPYGNALAASPVTAADWRTFARDSLAQFAARNRIAIAREVGDPHKLFDLAADMIADLPLEPRKVLVHGDYFPGNVLLATDLTVSAVLDFGMYTVVGDAQLDLAVAYLTLELIEETSAHDARFVRELILERHGEKIAPAFRFYRAWLAFSMADPANAAPPYPRLYRWSIAMLKLLAEGWFPA
jgi:aminoglycoside phosphotransferase (APT) family kinase protein